MREVTVGGVTAWLLDHPADWTESPTLRLDVPTALERGLTGRESRRPQSATLRTSFTWRATLPVAGARSLAAGLRAQLGKPVIAPIWPLAVCVEDHPTGPQVGGLLVAWREDFSEWAVDSDIGTLTDWDMVAPAIWGILVRTPEPEALHPELLRIRFEVQENGPASYALVPPVVVWTAGPTLPDGSAPLVFPWAINWASPTRAGAAEIEADRRELGPGRETANAIYPQESERPVAGLVTLSRGDDIAAFLRWWLAEAGAAEAHWAPALAQPVRLVLDAGPGETILMVAPAGGFSGPEIAIQLEMSYGPVETVKVAEIAGDLVTLATPLAGSFEADETVVTPLMLARHAQSVAELAFQTAEIAEVRLLWREVPAEEIVPSEEARGETLGRLAQRAWLYEIETTRASVVSFERFTSFERDLSLAGNLYKARPCDHTEIRQSIRLDRDEVTLSVRWWATCPLGDFLPGRLGSVMRLKVVACEVDGALATNPRTAFSGLITGVSWDGPYMQVGAAGANALFDRRVPTLIMQQTCNWDVYGTGCGLARGDWTYTATVDSVTGSRIVLRDFARAGGLHPGFGFLDWFALGILSRTDGLGSSFITRSSVLSGGFITLNLDRAMSPAVVPGNSVTVTPGCDNRDVTCQTFSAANPAGKFDNFSRFGGFPLLPTTNPIVQPLNKSGTTGGKK